MASSDAADEARRSLRRLSAGFALLIWIAVMGASTWNAVERPLNSADCIARICASADQAGEDGSKAAVPRNSLLQIILNCGYKFANDNQSQMSATR